MIEHASVHNDGLPYIDGNPSPYFESEEYVYRGYQMINGIVYHFFIRQA